MNKTTGAFGLTQELDRESLASVDLVLKATQDCSSGRLEGVTSVSWNVSDQSLLLVVVSVTDKNDNGPKFSRKWFTAGVTRDTQPGEEPVIELEVCKVRQGRKYLYYQCCFKIQLVQQIYSFGQKYNKEASWLYAELKSHILFQVLFVAYLKLSEET